MNIRWSNIRCAKQLLKSQTKLLRTFFKINIETKDYSKFVKTQK